MSRLSLFVLAAIAVAQAARAENVSLPAIDTEDGLLTRLFIAESQNPGYAQYDAAEVKRGMQAMKAVINNRLNNSPAQFGAPGAKGYSDIIGAKGQFNGFSEAGGRIAISADVKKRIDQVMKIANTGKPGKYAAFVQNCVEVARAPVSDPFKDVKTIGQVEVVGGAFGWRTAGSSEPGGKLIAIPASKSGVIAGNQYFSIKKS